mmetsp:Transcript_15722/g.42611  ORF Transcript_15722/g.42611 Transcript_15722/m.42611 type:complete len:211 (-) Transcript_15722:643-1275(-)
MAAAWTACWQRPSSLWLSASRRAAPRGPPPPSPCTSRRCRRPSAPRARPRCARSTGTPSRAGVRCSTTSRPPSSSSTRAAASVSVSSACHPPRPPRSSMARPRHSAAGCALVSSSRCCGRRSLPPPPTRPRRCRPHPTRPASSSSRCTHGVHGQSANSHTTRSAPTCSCRRGRRCASRRCASRRCTTCGSARPTRRATSAAAPARSRRAS